MLNTRRMLPYGPALGAREKREGCVMQRRRVLVIADGVIALAGIGGGWMGLWSQSTRPEAGPFDASRVNMQTEPAQGWAVRAGRLFDPKSGANLANQVILIKGGKITDVGPADKVQIP